MAAGGLRRSDTHTWQSRPARPIQHCDGDAGAEGIDDCFGGRTDGVDHRLKVGILSPVLRPGRSPSRELIRFATFQKPIREGVLRSSQLPDPIRTPQGDIRKPASW